MIMKTKLEIYNEMIQAAENFYIEFQKTQYAAEQYYIENRLWSPMEELKEYLGDNFSHQPFTLFYINLDEEGDEVEHRFLYGDICEVQEDGHVYFSDYHDGIIEWNEKQNCYVWAHWGNYTNIHILGFKREK